MSEVTMGTLYEINKSAMEQEKNMSSYAIREALKEIVRPYVSNS